MNTIIVDFEGLSFKNGEFHGGGDFSLRLVDYLIRNSINVKIINNTTQYFTSLTITNKSEVDYRNSIYLNPLLKNPNYDEVLNYKKSFFYVHGLRMLEMPYDSTSHKYYGYLKKIFVLVMQKLFKHYYLKKEINQIEKITQFCSKSNIITTGDHSKFIISASVNIEPSRIFILPPLYHNNSNSKKPSFNIPENYVLLLNGDRWVKNSYRFITAFTNLKRKLLIPSKLKLVVTGRPRFSSKITNNEDVIYLDYLEREELEYLLSNMDWLAFPSLNEGFGYPPLDALKYGKNVLCTSISAPNLIYNGMVVFCNPFSQIEIESRILYMLHNDNSFKDNNRYQHYVKITNEIDDNWRRFILQLND